MLTIKKDSHIIPKLDPVKFVEKENGIIKGYAVNTFHGMAKDYNEDRVSIIMNITKPNYKGRWPKCSYFGIFDGHGGDSCSNFLKDNMHKYVPPNPLRSPKTSTFRPSQSRPSNWVSNVPRHSL
jgi:serine/threonine protein phosphatase PrpC